MTLIITILMLPKITYSKYKCMGADGVENGLHDQNSLAYVHTTFQDSWL